ncbi:OLC1v1037035C1 [Oldenlandia corymbosa var. corymbosa]|uniref:OLC1v1037035C1 n=1 Tax=Oldenlandia corymbosa var. corymbosa TaxID=529605 RepID=A0AAV1CWT6_OLDCO|nr:OLC1v1037035C1 [Oldenlandia corymbosa var. corymbosa]
MKKLCISQLLGGQTLERMFPIRRSEVRNLVELFATYAKAGKAIDIRGELMRTTNNVISGMVMSKRCSGNDYEAMEVRKLIKEASELCGQFNLSDLFWFCKNLDLQGLGKRLKKVRDKYDEMMNQILIDHKEQKKGNRSEKDLLDILLEIAEDESAEFKLTEDNIKAFILDVFTGGSDTSAIAVEWAMAELINHPESLQKAVQEIDLVIGKNRVVEESDIPNLPYLQAVVKETLRVHPPGGPFILRESSEDCTIEGYHIPAKTRVLVHVWAINRDPNDWENPLEFTPERFLTEEGTLKGQLDVRGQYFQFLPFGSGRRGCPGISLAMQMVQISLAAMIQCFEWKVEGNGKIEMEEGNGATLPMAQPLVCFPVVRLNPLPL